MLSGVVMGKNWAPSVDQCRLQSLQFLLHLTNLLSKLLKGNGFTRIQKAAVDQTGSRPPNSNLTYSGARMALGSALELPLGPTTKLVFTSSGIKSTFPRMSQYDQEIVCCCCTEYPKTTLQKNHFFDFLSAHEAPTCPLFSPFNFKWP